ncbi:MAG: DUF47 family protein [Ignavibacteriales bacterium]|nr:hypothetical protein [Ignavibacteriaceae bacterium]MCK6615731.1 DUF47 family protein [Ignavibacteriaceae bacterium]QOJ29106.1 MAG: DUF47 family protein [Ignavibacteriales bacterium]
MLKSLLPKEEKYFEDFREIISYTQQGAKITLEFFAAETYDPAIYLKLKPIQNRCEEVSSKVVKRLNKTFITPFDREDIFALVKRLNAIGDNLFGAAVRVDTYNVTGRIEGASELANIVLMQINELDGVLQDLSNRHENIDECKAVRDLESEADNVYRRELKKLFQTETDPLTIFKKKEILDILENAADKCQSAANVITQILIKNS